MYEERRDTTYLAPHSRNIAHHRHRDRDRDLEVDRDRYSRRSASRSPRRRQRSRSYSRRAPSPTDEPAMRHQAMAVRSRGVSAATFRIPGYVNIPSDAQQHSVTIATLELRATFSWRSIPKIDTRVYMTVCNISNYSLEIQCNVIPARPTSPINLRTRLFQVLRAYTLMGASSRRLLSHWSTLKRHLHAR